MDILYYLATTCLVFFMLLATYDGFYLHIWKYKLFDRKESIFEHKIHTVRAILFPFIIWLLFINETSLLGFLVGVSLVLLDILALGVDAYNEKESRTFMGGLPKWEYLVHLFANAFHFSAITIVLALRLGISHEKLIFANHNVDSQAHDLFLFVGVNIIPGAIILALLHYLLMIEKTKNIWLTYRTKVICC